MKTITLRNKNNHGEKFSVTADVVENGEVKFSKVVEARSKAELDRTLENVLTIANQVDADFASITEGEWTPPVKPAPTPAPEPTAAELEKQAIAAKQMEVDMEYERAKKEADIKELAKTDAVLAAKLAELEVLKTKK